MGSVLRSSGYLLSSNTITAALSMIQGILIVRLVGIDGLGVITTVIALVTNIHRLLSFRMSEVVVRFLGIALEGGDKSRGAAVLRWGVLVEAGTTLAAFIALVALAPWAARVLVKDFSAVGLFWMYGAMLIGNLLYETSAGVLQTHRAFDRLARINILQSGLTFGLVILAFFLQQGVGMVLAAYLAGKLLAGIGITWQAARIARGSLGAGWWKFKYEGGNFGKDLFAFAINTNLNGTVNLLVRDNIPLFLGGLRSQTEVGYFKLALSIINLVMLPIEPFIWPTYTEITRTIAARQWAQTRRLLRRVSLIAAGWTATAGVGIAILGPWLLPLLYGADALPAYPAVLILLAGYGFANILNWNRPLLLALGKPSFPLVVAAVAGVGALGLTFLLVPAYGYLMQAGILSAFFILSIAIIVWRGQAEIHRQSRQDLAGSAGESTT